MTVIRWFAAFAFLVGLFASTQASVDSNPESFPIRVSGTFRGTPWIADVAVLGERVTGRLSLMDGSEALQNLEVEGALRGSEVDLDVLQNDKWIAFFSGTVDGLNVRGAYETDRETVGGAVEGSIASYPAGQAPEVDDDPPLFPEARDVPISEAFLLPVEVADSPSGSGKQSGLSSPLGAPPPCANCLVNTANDLDFPQVEPDIATDRFNNPDRMLSGYMTSSNGLFDVEYSFSTDRGKSWAFNGSITGYVRSADPVVDIDIEGRPFLVYVGANNFQDPCTTPGDSVLAVRYSPSFTATSLPFETSVAVSNDSTLVFHDKPWLTINRQFSPYLGYVYVSWTLFTNNCSTAQILLSRSTDHGASFGPIFPAVVSDGNQGTGSSIAVGPGGRINVAWWRISPTGQEQIVYDQCEEQSNGTIGCGTDQVVATISPNHLPLDSQGIRYLPGINIRAFSLPSLAIDNGPNGDGDQFVVWLEYHGTNADVYFSRKPSGQAWLPKTAIAATSTDEFFPAIVVGDDHNLRVTYYRREGTGSDDRFNVYTRTSTDDGATWSGASKINNGGDLVPTAQIVAQNGRRFVGDYISLDVNKKAGDPTKTEVPFIWTDSRRLIGSGPDHQLDIFTAVGC